MCSVNSLKNKMQSVAANYGFFKALAALSKLKNSADLHTKKGIYSSLRPLLKKVKKENFTNLRRREFNYFFFEKFLYRPGFKQFEPTHFSYKKSHQYDLKKNRADWFQKIPGFSADFYTKLDDNKKKHQVRQDWLSAYNVTKSKFLKNTLAAHGGSARTAQLALQDFLSTGFDLSNILGIKESRQRGNGASPSKKEILTLFRRADAFINTGLSPSTGDMLLAPYSQSGRSGPAIPKLFKKRYYLKKKSIRDF